MVEMSRKELREMRKIEEMRNANIEKKAQMTKWIAIGTISTVFVGFFLFLVVYLKGNNSSLSNNSDSGAAQIFSDSGEFRVASESITPVKNRPVTITEFADIECPACAQYHPIINTLLDLYPEDLAVNFKHFPISAIHKNAVPSAVAAEAANNQGKFFEMIDLLYERQQEWSSLPDAKEKFIEYARILELDIIRFEKDISDESLKSKIEEQRNEGIKAGVNATPTFFVNGKFLKNPSDISGFQQAIDKALEETPKVSGLEDGATTSAEENLPLDIDL